MTKLKSKKNRFILKKKGVINESRRSTTSRVAITYSRKSGTKSRSKTASIPPMRTRAERASHIIYQISFGKGLTRLSESIFNKLIETIQPNRPTIITDFPILANSTHAFLVEIRPEEKRIMVSDWGGSKNENLGDTIPGWKQYTDFLRALSKKHKLPIKYYVPDHELFKVAEIHHERFHGSGGCSNYIYAWIDKMYPNHQLLTTEL